MLAQRSLPGTTRPARPRPRQVMDARRIRSALAGAEIPLLDYLIVGKEILSMAERGIL